MVLPAPSGEGWPLYPIQAALNTIQNLPTISTGEVMASLTVTTIPLVALYIIAQKYIVDGFRTAGIK
jgi:ABC-type glycerol-3-phosphate transport system permease component